MASNYSNDIKLSLLDGNNLKTTYGAYVLETSGFLDIPNRKEGLKFSWPDEHGIDVDLDTVVFEAKDVGMIFLLKTITDLASLKQQVDLFTLELTKPGLRQIKIAGVPGLFLAYYKSGTVTRPKRGLSGTLYAKMDIKLTMPYPLIRQFYSDNSAVLKTVAVTVTTTKPIIIDWGDGIKTNVAGSGTYNHTYTVLAHYCIVIYEGVQGITALTVTNSTEI